MFTGIIREVGTVARMERGRGIVRLAIQAPKTASTVGVLESVSVNGVCLTVVQARSAALIFEVIPETLRVTSLNRLKAGARVNLEPSLSLADRLNGHIVLGHVDGVGVVAERRTMPGELRLRLQMPATLARQLVPKGPVAVDGVSLTVGSRLTGSGCAVHLVPETLRRTTLGQRRVGDPVNLELDYFAKVARLSRRWS